MADRELLSRFVEAKRAEFSVVLREGEWPRIPWAAEREKASGTEFEPLFADLSDRVLAQRYHRLRRATERQADSPEEGEGSEEGDGSEEGEESEEGEGNQPDQDPPNQPDGEAEREQKRPCIRDFDPADDITLVALAASHTTDGRVDWAAVVAAAKPPLAGRSRESLRARWRLVRNDPVIGFRNSRADRAKVPRNLELSSHYFSEKFLSAEFRRKAWAAETYGYKFLAENGLEDEYEALIKTTMARRGIKEPEVLDVVAKSLPLLRTRQRIYEAVEELAQPLRKLPDIPEPVLVSLQDIMVHFASQERFRCGGRINWRAMLAAYPHLFGPNTEMLHPKCLSAKWNGCRRLMD